MSSHVRFRTEGVKELTKGWTAAEPRGGATPPGGAVTAPRDLGALGGPLAGISFVAGVAGAVSLADTPYPRPGAEPADVRRYFQENPAARISVVGQLISAASLARFTASVAKLAARSGRGARGLRAAAIAGGALAAASLAASAALSAALTGSPGERDDSAAKLHRLMFAAGLASSVAGMLSPLYFVWGPAAWFIPAGRFPGLLVSGLAGARLGRR